MDKVAEIKKLYYSATKATIQRDLARAIDLLKSMPTEEERERAAVYMNGLSQMRSEWRAGGAGAGPGTKNEERRTKNDKTRTSNEQRPTKNPNTPRTRT